jgi:hypothetical protein
MGSAFWGLVLGIPLEAVIGEPDAGRGASASETTCAESDIATAIKHFAQNFIVYSSPTEETCKTQNYRTNAQIG